MAEPVVDDFAAPTVVTLTGSHAARRHRARGPQGSEQKRHMPHRRIRLPESLFTAADELAAAEKTSWQEFVRQAVQEKIEAARGQAGLPAREEVVAV